MSGGGKEASGGRDMKGFGGVLDRHIFFSPVEKNSTGGVYGYVFIVQDSSGN